jgi:protein-S-isoprenylcysteine O-methyltransferase Ste14
MAQSANATTGQLVLLTLSVWVLVELALLIRDGIRGKGTTARDRGTRSLAIVAWFAAFILAGIVTRALPHGSTQFGNWSGVAGVVIMWAGLAVRVWAVLALGSSFRTTVEVDADQKVVDRGPYRVIRHPSYTGMLLLAIGAGLTYGNWPSLAVLVALPLAAMLRRIQVEEATLVEVLGQPYVDYRGRTKRLVPGIW